MSPSSDIDPESDILRQYERMVQTQIETINGIDDKAAYVGRLIILFGGLIFTAVSFAVSSDAVSLSDTTVVAFVMLGIGSAALVLSFIFSIITYLSSRFRYGPSAGIGKFLASYSVNEQEYQDAMLRGYSSAIDTNQEVVEANSKRFKWCLITLLAAIIVYFGTGVLFIIPITGIGELVTAAAFLIIAGLLSFSIYREDYLTVQE